MTPHQDFTYEQEQMANTCEEIVKLSCNPHSNIRFSNTYVDEYGTLVIELSGGLNGNGHWNHYLKNLSDILYRWTEAGITGWLLDMKNDCLDDVFQARFGICEM